MESRANEERKGKKRGKGESKWEKGMDRIRKDVEEGETRRVGRRHETVGVTQKLRRSSRWARG